MSRSRSLTSIDVSEYDRIEAAMSESERGRWFLGEYLVRHRAHDTGILLDAIGRLESVVTGERDDGRFGRLRGDVMDMAHAITRTKAEIAAINAPDHDQSRLGGASAALDAIVLSTERATSDILGAAEQVQEAAWTLRESGSDPALCDELDRRATAIYTACSFQDLTAQRTARIIHTLRYLEDRLAAMMAIWGDELDAVPPAPGESRSVAVPADLCQSDVDRYIDMDASSADPIPPAATPLAAEAADAQDIVFLDPAEPAAVLSPAVDAPAKDLPAAEETRAEPEADASGHEGAEHRVAEPKGAETVAAENEAAETRPTEADAMDSAAFALAQGALPDEAPELTDVASAFAEIDALSEEERRALFS